MRTISRFQPPARRALPRWSREDLRHGCYKFLHAITTEAWPFQEVEAKYREHLALCAFMLDRKELLLHVFHNSIAKHNDARIKHHFHRERWNLIEQARKVLAAGDPPCWKTPRCCAWASRRLGRPFFANTPELVAGAYAPTWAPGQKARHLLPVEGCPQPAATRRRDGLWRQCIVVPICRAESAEGPASLKYWVEVYGISLRDEWARKSWARWKLPPFGPNAPSNPAREILASCWGNDWLYVGTKHGIFAIDASGDVQPFSKGLALPNIQATALVFLGGKLFAALEGGYLVAIDPQAGRFETLASSSRREMLSPFDNSVVLQMRAWHADVERGRLLMLVAQRPNVRTAYTSKEFPAKDTTNGLWEYNLKTRMFSRHVELFFDAVNSASPARPGHLLLSHVDKEQRRAIST